MGLVWRSLGSSRGKDGRRARAGERVGAAAGVHPASALLVGELGFLESPGLTSFPPNNVGSGFEIRSQH